MKALGRDGAIAWLLERAAECDKAAAGYKLVAKDYRKRARRFANRNDGRLSVDDDFDPYEPYIPDGHVLCPRCDGHQVVNCYCGGDLCVCDNHGEEPCPFSRRRVRW